MKLIVISDLHYRLQFLDSIADALKQVDLVVLAGDLTNTRKTKHVDEILERIRAQGPQVMAITGNWDSEKINTYLDELGVGLHARYRLFDDVAFIGVGGALPYIGGLQYTEAQFVAFLNKAVRDLDPAIPWILVSHQPPYGTSTSQTSRGKDAGSQAVRVFIEQYQPLFCFTGHIHEGVGIDQIGRTQVVNPGIENYALVEINAGAVNSVELIPIDIKT